jgi:hypothetical protein
MGGPVRAEWAARNIAAGRTAMIERVAGQDKVGLFRQ